MPRSPKVEKAFENMAHAARAAGIDTNGLSFQTGSSTYGIAYRVYTSPGHTQWPYAPPGGFLGMTAGEAVKTLDTMRYVFLGLAHTHDQIGA